MRIRLRRRSKLLVVVLFNFMIGVYILSKSMRTIDCDKEPEHAYCEKNLDAELESRTTKKIMLALAPYGYGTNNTKMLILPNQNTLIYESQNLQFCSMEGNGDKPSLVLIVVISSPGNFEARKALRSTLKRLIHQLNQESKNGVVVNKSLHIEILFFIGSSEGPTSTNTLFEEGSTYNDILVDDLTDTYLNLTVKNLRLFKWALSNCPRLKFIVKMDDDVGLNLINLRQFLDENVTDEELIGGFVYRNRTPVRTVHSPYGKYFAPIETWGESNYPDFVGGPLYIFGRQSLHKIYEASLSSAQLFHLEDVFLTGIIGSRHLGMKLTHIPSVTDWEPYVKPFLTTSCYIQANTWFHPLRPRTLKCWSYIYQPKYNCTYWPLFLSTMFC